ncbi:MAG: hypothetical protein HQL93_14115, partial [Magnetococcales bacterium]|nr:hypothetical protein [Magnetococcales bacterium]
VGEEVPVGYYDYTLAAWVPMDNGRIVEILSIEGGMAQLDIQGNGVAASDYELTELGITQAELQQLAKLYAPQATLWRIPLPHFSPIDANWPYLPDSSEAEEPQLPTPSVPDNIVEDDPELKCGSVIEPQNGFLGEQIPVTNAPFTLNYRTDLTPGYKGQSAINIPVTGERIPNGVKSVKVVVSAKDSQYLFSDDITESSGSVFVKTFPAEPSQNFVYAWDGKDAFGRPIKSAISMNVAVGYTYKSIYGGATYNSTIKQKFGQYPYSRMSRSITSRDISVWNNSKIVLGNSTDSRSFGIGGWTLSNHHFYNPTTRELLLGNGSKRITDPRQMDTVYSSVEGMEVVDGQEVGVKKQFALPFSIALAGNGNLIITESDASRVVQLSPDGKITLVAGNGVRGFSGDGGLAIHASMNQPRALAVGGDGSIYIADNWGHRVRKVSPTGIITTVAGNGRSGFSGDNGPAVDATLHYPTGIAVAKDGTLYIADTNNHRIRKVATNGIITTIAGTGTPGYNGSMSALDTQFNLPHGVTLASDGTLYVADAANHRIRRITPWGLVSDVAGNGQPGSSGDGSNAYAARLNWPIHVEIVKGNLYITEYQTGRVRYVDTSKIIRTLVGNEIWGDGRENGPARLADLYGPTTIAVRPDGEFFVTGLSGFVYRVHNPLPGYGIDDITIVADDGQSLYLFNPQGRHLGTYHALTREPLFQFQYDKNGYLIGMEDADGQITQIERTGRVPTAIVAPDGQRTNLTVDANGYLASVTNPASETHAMQYTTEGLMTTFRTPRNFATTMSYDNLGRLVREDNPAGGFWELSKINSTTDTNASITSALGRKTLYRTETLPNGDKRQLNTNPDGKWLETL